MSKIEVIYTNTSPQFANMWTEFGHEQRILEENWVREPGRRPIPVSMIWGKDIPIKLRDGTTLYGDVFRPIGSEEESVSAILTWSPYGKTGTGHLGLDMMPWRVGVPKDKTSDLESFEGLDPAEWIQRGYAVVNVDARGVFYSEGDIQQWGSQEARDGYDTIEWIAEQKWCNGSVGMAGNSWLATAQWFIAAEQPPHLKAIAPWEGLSDLFRQNMCRGGIPNLAFGGFIGLSFAGKNKREDTAAMAAKYPLFNEYWADKEAQLKRINQPMYATASYSTGLHNEGSHRGFFLSSSKEKWLRYCATQEWHDLYQPENNDDLQLFFDRYLKGIQNDWDKTPQIRLSLLGYNRPNVVNRPVASLPPPEFEYTRFYLDAETSQLTPSLPSKSSSVEYDAELRPGPGVEFVHKFSKYTELCGFSKAHLFMSAPDHDDMDVFVVIRKLDKDGKPLEHFNIPLDHLPEGTKPDQIPKDNIFRHVGPNQCLRASQRYHEEEPGLTPSQRASLGPAYVYHPLDRHDKVTPGQIVELVMGIWPGGMIFDADESMSFEIKGFLPIRPEFEFLLDKLENYNKGHHQVHCGGDYASSLLVALSPSSA